MSTKVIGLVVLVPRLLGLGLVPPRLYGYLQTPPPPFIGFLVPPFPAPASSLTWFSPHSPGFFDIDRPPPHHSSHKMVIHLHLLILLIRLTALVTVFAGFCTKLNHPYARDSLCEHDMLHHSAIASKAYVARFNAQLVVNISTALASINDEGYTITISTPPQPLVLLFPSLLVMHVGACVVSNLFVW